MSNNARSIYLDFETYYEEKTYSLQYMPIEEYVRSPLFDVQLLCYAIDDDPVQVVIGSDSIRDVLPTLGLDKNNTITFIQNARFDGFILTDYFGIDVANPVCSRAMARFAGVSRLTCESLAAQSAFFGHGEKGGFLQSMSGRHLFDLTNAELQEYIEYCQQDVELLRKNVKAMLPVMTADALAFSIMTNKMYTQPRLRVDILRLAAYLGKLQHDRHTALAGLQARFGIASQEEFHKALRSKKKFCELLIQAGGKVPLKLSEKKTQTALLKLQQTLSAEDYQREVEAGAHLVYEPALAKTDAGFMALCASDNPLVAALANTRRGFNSSIEESRAETLLAIGQRGPLPVPLEAFQAITGRYTGGGVDTAIKSDSVNLQNLPKRTGNTTLRQCIKAPDGFVIVAGDSSQVEARVGAWSAGAERLLNDFRSGRDPYVSMATEIYHTPYEELLQGVRHEDHPEHKQYKFYRQIGKTCVLQLQYGAGPGKLAEYLRQQNISLGDGDAHLEECKRIVSIYRNVHKAIPAFWNTCENVLQLLIDSQPQVGVFGGPDGRTYSFSNQYNIFNRKVPGVEFPDKFRLFYPGLCYHHTGEKSGYYYDLRAHGTVVKKHIYGSALMNNCIAEDSLVYTNSGWKPIQYITTADLVYDGVEFVSHGGILNMGLKQCIDLDGLFLTPDHKILENGVWVHAKDTKRPDRPSFRGVDCTTSCGVSKREVVDHSTSLQQRQAETLQPAETFKKVYDILNCGPRHRFVVKGTGNPVIAHNCVQGLAFAIMRWQALQINKRYPVIANVHDSWASLVPEDKVDDALEVYKYWMSQVPEWATGVPIACEVKCGTDFTVV